VTGPATAGYEAVIGLEVHAQLLTESKMFCGCSARYAGAPPNSHVCPVCLGLPGSLPVINEKAFDSAIKVAAAMNCDVAPVTRFDRKNYPYPDIPKGYQISQYDMPIGRDGHIEIHVAGGRQRVGIIRVHLEEDTGKSIHANVGGREVSLVDYNRAGVPLLEIVSEADLRSSEAARQYFSTLREVLVYLGVSSGDMQEGALRADVNVSVRKPGDDFGVKVEIKNLNSFRSVGSAVDFEIKRHVEILEAGGNLSQETRGWDDAAQVTIGQRSKEFAEDYRYFPEPDLPPLNISPAFLDAIRSSMPETANSKRARFMDEYGLSEYDATVVTQDPDMARLLDQTVGLPTKPSPKIVANWLTGEFLRLLNETGIPMDQTRITPAGLGGLVDLLGDGTITTAIGKTVFEEMFRTGDSPASIVDARGLRQVSDHAELEAAVKTVISENPALVSDYVEKDRKTEGPLVGKVMAATGGKANAAVVKQIIARFLLGSR
jgi:aspartyl-tRNA(Asn)/glutamyl-tRNA(Gln) amidotransferase subunit B